MRFQLAVEDSVRCRRTRLGRIARSFNSSDRFDRRFTYRVDRRLDWCLGRNIRYGGSSFFVRQRLFTGCQVGLLLLETLFLIGLPLDREALLHLAFDLSPLLFLGLLLLAGNKKRERRHQRQDAKLFHCEVRPG